MASKRLSFQEVEEVVNLYKNTDITLTELSIKYGVTASSINNWLNKLDIPKKKKTATKELALFRKNKVKKRVEDLKSLIIKNYPSIKFTNIPDKVEDYAYYKTKYGICKMIAFNLKKKNSKIDYIANAVDKNEYFLNKLRYTNPTIFHSIEILEKYSEANVPISFKTKYGLCKMSPTDLYKVKKIPISCAINPTEYFINQAKEIHGDEYDYSLVEYINNETKIFITSKYRTFDQTPQGHLSGRGCKLVGREKSKKWIIENPTGWSWDAWEKSGLISKNFVAFQCYIIKCWNDDHTEEFYKIGKTFVSVKERFRCNAIFPYNYEILMLTNNSAKYISELENKLKKAHKKYKYLPKLDFNGMQECFSKIDFEIVNKIMNE